MRFKCRTEKPTPLPEQWRPHFCLLPRPLENGECAWLETVEKRGKVVRVHDYEFGDSEHIELEYREKLC